MNGSLVFVIVIVAIVMLTQVIKLWIKERRADPVNDDELAATLAKIDKLEQRIEVLERIVTENRFDLKREIDSL